MAEAIIAGPTRYDALRVKKLESEIGYRELLLEEVIHRTKNILQLAVSILGEEADCARDAFARRIVKNVQKQVVTLCRAQNRFFAPSQENGSSLSVRVGDICASIRDSFLSRTDQVTLAVNVDEVKLSRHQELCVSLILQELVMNALKHAFPSGLRGSIVVELSADVSACCRLSVQDNGIGQADSREASTGLKLVEAFASALGGTFAIASDHGTVAEVTFPLAEIQGKNSLTS